jgi:hypothetical protein
MKNEIIKRILKKIVDEVNHDWVELSEDLGISIVIKSGNKKLISCFPTGSDYKSVVITDGTTLTEYSWDDPDLIKKIVKQYRLYLSQPQNPNCD